VGDLDGAERFGVPVTVITRPSKHGIAFETDA